jgi:hypothetical protein
MDDTWDELFITTPQQAVEDPIAHVASKHASTDLFRRMEPCPLGCGMILRPKFDQTKVPLSEIELHTAGDRCRKRLEQRVKARSELDIHLVGRAATEFVAAREAEDAEWFKRLAEETGWVR